MIQSLNIKLTSLLVTLTLSCLISIPVHAENETKKHVEPAPIKVTLPRPKLSLTDEYVQNLPIESARKVMREALLVMSQEYEKDLISQLNIDSAESPYSERTMKIRIYSLFLDRKKSTDVVPSVMMPLAYKMLDDIFSRFQAVKNLKQARLQSLIVSLVDPLKSRLDVLQERLDKLDASSAASVKKGWQLTLDSFKSPAIIILIVLQVAMALFVVIKLG